MLSPFACIYHRVRVKLKDGEEIHGEVLRAESEFEYEEQVSDSMDIATDDGRALTLFEHEIEDIEILD